MNVRHGIAGMTCLLAVAGITMSKAHALTEDQLNRALEIEAKAAATDKPLVARGSVGMGIPNLSSTFAGQKGKTVRPLVAPIEYLPVDQPVARGAKPAVDAARAVVTRYDYATGITTRTTVDLGTGRALDIRKDVNYPTPLADEELAQAIALARQKVSDFDSAMKVAKPDELSVSHLAPVDNDPSSATYGHRLVYLWVDRPTRTRRILVDLSTNEVVTERH
jgi:hypothetical protein